MQKENIRNWLVHWFEENSMIKNAKIDMLTSSSYFEEGLIDSFMFIQLIADIEEKYNLEFENEQFEDRSFSTIDGLVEIIERNLE